MTVGVLSIIFVVLSNSQRINLMPKGIYERTPEHRAQIAIQLVEARKQRKPLTIEQREIISSRMMGNTNGINNPGPIGRVRPQSERDAISRAHMGVPKSMETRARMSAGQLAGWTKEKRARASATRRRHKDDYPNCACGQCRIPKSPTRIETFLLHLLEDYPEVKTEEPFPPYRVDAYLPPPYHLAFEADGSRWHLNAKRDKKRDKFLFKKYELPVVRMTGTELYRIEQELRRATNAK